MQHLPSRADPPQETCAIEHTDYCTGPTRQHELDHTDHTDHAKDLSPLKDLDHQAGIEVSSYLLARRALERIDHAIVHLFFAFPLFSRPEFARKTPITGGHS